MKNIFFFILLLFVTNITFGQDILSFNDCLKLALTNNLNLKTAINEEQIAVFQYKLSYGSILPTVNGVVDSKNIVGRQIDQNTNKYVTKDLKNYSGSLNASFNLFSGFTVINTIKSLNQQQQIQKTTIEKVKYDITIDLAQKFITILYLQEIVIANKEQIKSSEKQLELAILKFNSGVIAESAVFKIKSQKATEELNLLTNENRLTDNFISLKQLMNMPLENEIQLIRPNIDINKNALLDENPFSTTKKAIEINPLYAISLLKENKAKTAINLARAALYPSLNLRLNAGSFYTDNYYAKNGEFIQNDDQITNNYSKGLRFTILIPIFSPMDIYSKIKTSKMDFIRTKLNTEIIKNNLSKEILKAIADTKTSIKKIESSTTAYEFSKKSYDSDALKFELGKINITELNVSKMIYNNAQAELIQSKYELLFNNSLINFYSGEEFRL